MFDPDELVYLTAAEITEIHDQVIASDGGLPGVHPDLSIHGLVGRIESNLTYIPFENIAQLAALYAEVIARGHYFNDGNKRTALLTMVTFLDLKATVSAMLIRLRSLTRWWRSRQAPWTERCSQCG